MDDIRTVEIRCVDHAENLIMMRIDDEGYPSYFAFSIEDAYLDCDHTGFFSRWKRAWHAFWDKPICYAEVIVQDEERLRKFLLDCLALTEHDGENL